MRIKKSRQSCFRESRFATQSQGPDLRPALAVTRFIRLHQGAQKGSAANLEGRCSHRTASKTSMPTLNEQRNLFASVYQIHHPRRLFKNYFHPQNVSWPHVVTKRVTQGAAVHSTNCPYFPANRHSFEGDVREYFREGPGLEHARQRGLFAETERITKRSFLPRTGSQYPNLPCRRNRLVAYRDALWRRFAGRYRAVNRRVRHYRFRLAGKK